MAAPSSNKPLKQGLANTDLMSFLSYRDFLSALHKAIKELQPKYSYLDFSADLGFSHTNVSYLFITGRRKLTPTTRDKLVGSLGLKGVERRYFLALVAYNNARLPEKREELFQKLVMLRSEGLSSDSSKAMLAYFSEWYHPVIRELTGLEEFRSDPAWIAEKLLNKVLPKQAKESLELLEKLSLIIFDESQGRHVKHGGHVKPDREVETLAAIRFHQKMIELGRESLTKVPSKRRDINSVTLNLSDENAALATKKIHDCIRSILAMEEAEAGDQVYQLNIQLFPFTRGGEK